ncbi:hypothetical protein FJ656_30590, partial [Schumannella luteola]
MTAIASAPRIEHHRAPLGIGESRPRLSWTVEAPDEWRQAGYELAVTRDDTTVEHAVSSPEQILVPWPGGPLR